MTDSMTIDEAVKVITGTIHKFVDIGENVPAGRDIVAELGHLIANDLRDHGYLLVNWLDSLEENTWRQS